jgi:L-2-hydroxyglutarate oxidase LhgO
LEKRPLKYTGAPPCPVASKILPVSDKLSPNTYTCPASKSQVCACAGARAQAITAAEAAAKSVLVMGPPLEQFQFLFFLGEI